MTDRPTLGNGYLWVCNSVMSEARAHRIEEGLEGVRCNLRMRDVKELGHSHLTTLVELWVHPDDDRRVLSFLRSLPSDL